MMDNKNKRRTIYYRVIRKRDTVPKLKSGLLLSKAIEGFLLACRARRLSLHTIDDYQRTLKKFLTHTGDMPINTIGTSQISAFLGAQTTIGEKTLLNYHEDEAVATPIFSPDPSGDGALHKHDIETRTSTAIAIFILFVCISISLFLFFVNIARGNIQFIT